jgi:hypothetical protein
MTDWLAKNWKNLIADMIVLAVVFTKNLVMNVTIAAEKVVAIFGAMAGFMTRNWKISLNESMNVIIAWTRRLVRGFVRVGKQIASIVAQSLKGVFTGDEVDIDIGKFFGKAFKVGKGAESIQDAISEALKGTRDFVPLLEGFKRTTEALPDFVTSGFKFFKALEEAAPDDTPDTEGDAASAAGQASTKVAEALRAGSKEAFSLLGRSSGTTGAEKTQKKIEKANERTANATTIMAQNGIKLQDVRIVDMDRVS